MEPLVTDDLDAAATLAAAEAALMERRAAEVKDLLLALRWADLHSSDPQAEPGAIPVRYGGDRLVEIGGEGTPPVRDLCVHELSLPRPSPALPPRLPPPGGALDDGRPPGPAAPPAPHLGPGAGAVLRAVGGGQGRPDD